MASSSNIFKYPPRLYDEGKSILQHHSMNHNCYLSKIGLIREGLGQDVWDKLKESSLGVFIKLAEAEYTWAAKKVHFILTNQLRVNNLHEIWSLIDGRPIRFSLNEFAAITGLNCGVIEPSDICEADHSELWEAMKVGTSDGPLFTELQKVMDLSKAWVFEKRMMVARLCLLSVGVHGIHHGSRIPLSSARRVLDPVGFEKYPWGRVAFDSLVTSVKLVKYDQESYVIHGCVHALLIWFYESVPGIGEDYGLRRPTLTGVPLLDWQSTRKGIKLKEFLLKEKTKHGQMRVRHMIPVSEDNMYPKWGDADADANKDPLLDNLIKDIINNQLPLNAWDGVGSVAVANKNVATKKRKLDIEDEVESSIKCQQNKMKVADRMAEEDEKIPKKKQKTSKEYVEDDAAEKKSIFDIWKMLETINGTISELDKNMRTRMDALENKFESLVTKRVSDVDVKEMKESKPEFATSNNNEDDEATSKSPSWIVEENPTSHDGLPIQRVVKKVYTVRNKKKKEGEISDDLVLFEKKDGTKAERKNYEKAAVKLEATKTVVKGSSKPALAVAVTKAAKKGGSKAAVKEVAAKNPGFKASKIGGAKAAVKDEAAKKDGSKATNKSATMAGNKMKMKSIIQEDDVVDVTDQVQDDALKMVSSSEDTFSDPGQQHANKVLNATLTAMLEGVKNLDEGMTVGRRVPRLAGSQKYPYAGNSTVKRIITDGEPSSSIPDHLKPVSNEKVHELFDFLEADEEDDLLQTSNGDTRFYWQIMTLREQWPHEKYGWLKDYVSH
ncbi:hypothetical protein ISN44_As12g034170, partial [Arabidopsis suecica]